MLSKRISIFLYVGFLYFPLIGQDYIDIQIPSAEEETDYVWRTIIDIAFFEQHNYQLSLPQGPMIEKLKVKSRAKQLTDEDYEQLKNFMVTRVYRKQDYIAGYEKIAEQEVLLNKMIRRLGRHKRDWSFKVYESYPVVLTLYGSGGSYDPDNGRIIVFTTSDGRFKTSDNAAHVVIHEVVHIGLEQSIIQVLKVPHVLKERIVDRFVLAYFRKWIPSYRVQEMGEDRIDPFLQKKKDAKVLKSKVKQVLDSDFPNK